MYAYIMANSALRRLVSAVFSWHLPDDLTTPSDRGLLTPAVRASNRFPAPRAACTNPMQVLQPGPAIHGDVQV